MAARRVTSGLYHLQNDRPMIDGPLPAMEASRQRTAKAREAKIFADPIGIGVKAGKSSRTSCSQAVGRKEHSEVSGRAWCSHGRSSRFRGSYSMDEDIFRKLEERLGPLHARQRLGIETDHEAQIFGQGLLFFHIGNWY